MHRAARLRALEDNIIDVKDDGYTEQCEALSRDLRRIYGETATPWHETGLTAFSATDITHADLLLNEGKWLNKYRYVLQETSGYWVELTKAGIARRHVTEMESVAVNSLQLLRDMRLEASGFHACPDVPDSYYKSLESWDKALGNSKTSCAAVETVPLRSDAIRMHEADFDDPQLWLWCSFTTGVVNVSTGEVIPHSEAYRRGIYQLKRLGKAVTHLGKPEDAPTFLHFINWFAGGRSDLTEYLQMVIGYLLVSKNQDQVFFNFVGKGGNGKSTLAKIIAKLMGDHAAMLDHKVLSAGRGSDSADRDGSLLSAYSSRVTIVTEAKDGSAFNEAIIKNMSGGDTVTARAMRENNRAIESNTVLMWFANILPITNDTSNGMKRRMITIPCDGEVANGGDSNIESRILENELAGVLAWAIEGAHKYLTKRNELGAAVLKHPSIMPECVRIRRDAYFESMDTMGGFIKHWGIEPSEDGKGVSVSALLDMYRTYLNDELGLDRTATNMTSNKFTPLLINKIKEVLNVDAQVVAPPKKAKMLTGIRLNDDDTPDFLRVV
jgi:P4 family phage/plasmid primase-like protien